MRKLKVDKKKEFKVEITYTAVVGSFNTPNPYLLLLFSEIMPSCSYCEEKKLVCIIIVAPFSHQPSFCVKYIKLNMYLFYNVRLVSNTKYLWFAYFIIF